MEVLKNPAEMLAAGYALPDASLSPSALSPAVADVLVAANVSSTGKNQILLDKAVEFVDSLVKTIGLTAVDMVLLVAYLLSYHENYQAAKAQYGDALGQVTAPALQLVLACYFSQTTLYDEPLSKKVWLYYAQIPWGDFTSHLMKFFSLLHWSAHISPNTWNRALSVLYARLPQAAPAPPQPTLKQQLIFTSSASSTSDDYAVLNSSSDEESTSPMAVVATRSRTVPASGRS